jgi:hypothetical protein
LDGGGAAGAAFRRVAVARRLKRPPAMTPYSIAVELVGHGLSTSEVVEHLRRIGLSDADANVVMSAAARSAAAVPAASEAISEPEPQYAAPPFEAPRWLRNSFTVLSAFKVIGVVVNSIGIWALLHRHSVSPMFWGAVLAEQAYLLAFIGGTVAMWKRRAYSPDLMISAAVLMVGSWICLCLAGESASASLIMSGVTVSALVAYFKEWRSQSY